MRRAFPALALLACLLAPAVLAVPASLAPATCPALKHGCERWSAMYAMAPDSFEKPRALATSPDGKVLFLTAHGRVDSPQGLVLAYATADGALLWAATPERTGALHALLPSHDGEVLYASGYGSQGAVVVALDPDDGALLWSTVVPSSVPLDAVLRLSADGSMLHHAPSGGFRSALTTLDAATGEIAWTYAVAGRARTLRLEPMPDGEHLLLTSTGFPPTLHLLRARDGAPQHVFATEQVEPYGLALSPDGETAFVAGFGGVVAVDLERRTTRWSVPGNLLTLARAGERLVVVEGQPLALVALDSANGSRLWRQAIDGWTPATLAVSSTHAYVANRGDPLARDRLNFGYAFVTTGFRVEDGQKAWERRLDASNVEYGCPGTWDPECDNTMEIALPPSGQAIYVAGQGDPDPLREGHHVLVAGYDP